MHGKPLSLLLGWLITGSLLVGSPDVIPLGPEGGDVRSLAVHPKRPERVFLGTADGQLFVSEDFGEHWTRLLPGLPRRDIVVDNLVFDPQDPDSLYAATWELKNDRGRLYRTRDGGLSWEEIPLDRYQSSIRALAVAPTDPQVIAAGITEGVILSTDGGQTWDRITRGYRSLYHVSALAFDPRDSQTLYVGTWRLAWRTNDRGKSWEAIHKGMLVDSHIFSLVIDPQEPSRLYAGACSGIYKSQSAGQLWEKLGKGLPEEARRTRSLVLSSGDSNHLYAGTTIGLYVSRDAGASWKQHLSDVVINAVLVHPGDPTRILLGTDDAGVLKSTDGGESFRPVNRGFVHRQIAALASHPTRPGVYYAAVSADRHYGGFFFSESDGQEWQPFNEGLEGREGGIKAILAAPRKGEVFLGTDSGVFRGRPGEQSWQRVSATAKLTVTSLDFLTQEESQILLGTTTGLFLLDLDRGTVRRSEIPVYSGPIRTVLRDPASGRLYAGTNMGVFRSDDQGESWTIKVRGLPYTAVLTLWQSGARILCGTPNGIYYSEDAGEQWNASRGVFPIDIVSLVSSPEDPDQLFASDALVGYLFFSNDRGTSWRAIDLSHRVSRIGVLVYPAAGRLLAGTWSDGVYQIASLQDAAARAVSASSNE